MRREGDSDGTGTGTAETAREKIERNIANGEKILERRNKRDSKSEERTRDHEMREKKIEPE